MTATEQNIRATDYQRGVNKTGLGGPAQTAFLAMTQEAAAQLEVLHTLASRLENKLLSLAGPRPEGKTDGAMASPPVSANLLSAFQENNRALSFARARIEAVCDELDRLV